MKEETPATTAKRQTNHIKMTPRLERLLKALYTAPNGITREEADRVTPASNSPEYIRQLRIRLNLEIPCVLVRFITTDWTESSRGVYRLTDDDRQRVRAFLE